MASEIDQWCEIDEPPSPDREVLRRVGPEHGLDFYRGRLYGGRYFLRLVVDASPPPQLALPMLSNISITLLPRPHSGSELTVTLANRDYVEPFRALCADLISSTRFLTRKTQKQALPTVLARIARWRELLSGRRGGILTSAQQLGLFGELVSLRDIFLMRTTAFAALSAWCGPSGAEQDFQFAGWLFEIKSQMASSDKLIRISSQHQLDPVSGSICLFHQVFAPSDEALGKGCTLRALVHEIRQLLQHSSPAEVDLFMARLIEVGYEPLDEYDITALLLVRRDAYEITDGFPKIVASELASGISDVRYSLSPEVCSAFRVEEQELLRRAFDAK